jgi:hypothetical protein
MELSAMLTPIVQVLTSRAAGPAASALAVLLAILLAVTWTDARRTEAQLHRQVAALSRQADGVGAYWQARASRCEGAGRAGRTIEVAARDAAGTPDEMAQRLAQEPPAGFDVCARMESADQAVLNTLK